MKEYIVDSIRRRKTLDMLVDTAKQVENFKEKQQAEAAPADAE